MTAPRETIFAALFALTNNVSWNLGNNITPDTRTFITRTRKVALFSDVPDGQQPWLGQAEHKEQSAQRTNLPYKRIWSATWLVYHQGGKVPGVTPTTWNNMIIDALEQAMAPKPTDPGFLDNRNTLSGLVYHCYIDGEIFKDPGDIDEQALISIPITLLVP